MNVPADAARAPGGDTYVIRGTRALSMRVVIFDVASRVPPGVSIWSSTARAPLCSPSAIRRSTYRAVIGLMTPSIFPTITTSPFAAAAPPSPSAMHATASPRRT